MVVPVVHALRSSDGFKNRQVAIKVLALPGARPFFSQHNVPCVGFGEYIRPSTDADALRWGAELALQHHSAALGDDLRESIAYLGLNYKDLVTRLGKEQAAVTFQEKGRHSFYPLTVMERILDDVQPDLVVTCNSPNAEAAAIDVANRRGITTLAMTDLFTGPGGYTLRAQHVTFINEFAIRKFREDGCVATEGCTYYCTGNPAFDKLLGVDREKDADWMHLHFLRSATRTHVLHADIPAFWDTQAKRTHVRTEAEVLEDMEQCYQAARHNNAVYLIRPHPSQPRDMYAKWLMTRHDAYWAGGDCDLTQLLRNVDLVVLRATTVGVEAAFLEKRILQLDCSRHTDLPLVEMGIARGVDGYAALASKMKYALTDNGRFQDMRRRMSELLPRTPAATSIAALILNLVDKGSARHAGTAA